MGVPLEQAKSELFRALGHPVRIRVLELLDDGPKTVRQLLDVIAIEASRLSQQLAILRRTGLVVAQRDGNTVAYSLSTAEVTDLLRTARQVLAHRTLGQGRLLAELRLEHAS
ncbi:MULTISPECIES: ArsR/SmtB family transcription factor [Pseudonocardiaceae]|uniref:Transcriptional regulator n=2 Tax=Pseudonocardiaceae TaxID=2070 RepID=A0A2V4ACM4_9PSEU|nr:MULTISPECIES: metalloregulator ArsR/SmtB family transcription factor [Pseudonocardiaceae]PXY17000.1 transcriptional regulator [Prauserella muralis]TWE23648.1 ArsR family transcriptional regulator [Prauserella muralis]WIV57946.1 metalloregulator ArsR/SmtB family transcription factor [Amycolatopsis sp. 2-2]